MKPKLFLNSTDVANITGYSLRNARNIMDSIRKEKGLGKRQAISIFDFCTWYKLPQDVVFKYINSKDFKLLPIDEETIRKTQSDSKQIPPNINMPPIFSPDFDPLISKPRTITFKNSDLDDLSEEAG